MQNDQVVSIFQSDHFVLSTNLLFKFNVSLPLVTGELLQNTVDVNAYRRRVVESFLINQKACSCNVINRNDGANFPTVYSVLVSNK